ncbi:MAG: UvrD-helicase domain-containing protein [Candidatus Krumholzibacteria bacterium]|nr:UvrD-helicase domain-containing protein [Candidatus Krumholzibacteria bacterium]
MSARRVEPVDIETRVRATRDLSTSLCLEAGAGTGKTTILVERIISILREGAAQCAQIVAITFTEKAAAEMKGRVAERIELLLADGATEGIERERLETARRGLERAQISTIHAFASTLLHEYPIEAGVDPRFSLLDGIDGAIFLDESFDEYLSEEAARHEATLRGLVEAAGPSAFERLRSITLRHYSSRGRRAEGRPRRGTEDGGGDAAGLLDAWRRSILAGARELRRLSADHCTDPSDRGASEIARLLEDAAPLESAAAESLEPLLLSLKPPSSKGNRRNWTPPEICARQKEAAARLREEHERFGMIWTDRLRDGILRWCEGFRRFTDERKCLRSLLDFDDLLLAARRLLDDPVALGELRGRYRRILVDEFQDTDPLQAEIILLLAASPGPGDDGPEPGKLFVVGDPKQSIYRFRGADIEAYERVKDLLARSGEVVSITQNFRSVPGIVEWVNGAFSRIIVPPAGGGRYQPVYEPIAAAREGSGTAMMLLDLETGETGADGIREIEGAAAARLVAWLVGSGREVADRRGGGRRPVRFGDIALIYRGTTGIDNYEEPLREAGIPYLVEGGTLFYTRQEVRDIASALWAVEDPYDPLALVSTLRSPLFGMSDEEIFLFTREGGRLDCLDPGDPGAGHGDLREAMALLADLHRRRGELGPAGVLRALLEQTGYLSLLKLAVHGRQAVLNARKIMDTARIFEERMHPFRYFARWLRDQDLLGAAEGESPAIDEEEDAVRLLTIHKAKGLQFPVVVLVNLVQQERRGERDLIGRDGSLALLLSGGLRTSDYDDRARLEEEMAAAETARLLYVAATRAADLLVIPKIPGGRGLSGIIEPFLSAEYSPAVEETALSGLPVIERTGDPCRALPAATPRSALRSARELGEWGEERQRLRGRAAATSPSFSPSGLVSMHGARGRGGAPEVPEGEALLFGSAFHRMMEAIFGPAAPDIATAASRAAAEHGIPGREAELRGLAAGALALPLLREASEAEIVRAEVPFSLPGDGAGDGGPIHGGSLLEGRIDLIFRSGGRWTIVDFKTDEIAADQIDRRMEIYLPQAAAYAHAALELGIGPLERVVLLFVRPGIARAAGDPAQLAALGSRLVRAAADRPPSET